ncbi:MAG: hypothetical protein AAB774_02550 [Patescibacteria group bacterium]
MSETNLIKDNQPSGVKDIKDKKIERITSALYLVTNFLSDNDPIKWKIREKALNILLVGAESANWRMSHITDLLRLIDVALYDQHSSSMNLSILREEYLKLNDLIKRETANLDALIGSPSTPIPSAAPPSLGQKTEKASPKIRKTFSLKTDRQEIILNSLTAGVWLPIKDIAKNLQNFSGKTVQRELNTLVIAGLVKKTGERRWSRYTKI